VELPRFSSRRPSPLTLSKSSRPGSRSRGAQSPERCQRDRCLAIRQELTQEKEAHVNTSKELAVLKKYLQKEIRKAVSSAVDPILRELETRTKDYHETLEQRRVARKKAKELASELIGVYEARAALTRRVADLEGTAAKTDIAHRYELRRAGRKLRGVAESERKAQAEAAAAALGVLAEAAERRDTELVAAEECRAVAAAEREDLKAAEAAATLGLAHRAAEVAKYEALELAADLTEAEASKESVEYLLFLAEKREQRAKAKNIELEAKLSDVAPATQERTADEWAMLSREARYKAHQRAQKRLDAIFSGHAYDPEDLATALHQHGLLEKLFDTHAGFDIYFDRVRKLMTKLEEEDYGVSFALYLRYELRLTMPKIFEVTKAACKLYNRETDRYKAKVILYHRHRKGVFLKVPRLAPPRSKLEPIIRSVEETLGCEHTANGRVAFRPVATVFQELVARDPGSHGMPALPFYLGGAHPVPIVLQWDATGFGKLQLTTAAIRNPYLPMSAQQLRYLGLGNCGDDKSGAKLLMGPNIDTMNGWMEESNGCLDCGAAVHVKPQVYVSTDVSALRHTEHLANSGWCCCSRDFALRTTPKKPTSFEQMFALLKQCKSPTALERFDLAHEPRPGETVPRACPACAFGHGDEEETMLLYAELLATEAKLRAVDTKAGKAAFSKWRMAHAASHSNVQPAEYGRPLLHYDMDDFILDLLHLAELGAPKTPWKHGVLNNASDDARQKISDKLAEWRHALDCRRKDDNRSRAAKWFTGEAWATFCAGERGSPGGPKAIAELVMIIAEDMQRRGVTIGGGTAEEEAAAEAAVAAAEAPAKPKPKPKGKAGAAARNADSLATAPPAEPVVAQRGKLKHVPTAIELAADPADLEIIRKVYGSRAQTIINTLLSFDAYFNWYYPLKDHDLGVLDTDEEKVMARAFENCCTAIDLHEICERLAIRSHKSFLFHGAVFKVTRDILKVGNNWAFGTSSLELSNADTKRVADQCASRRIEFCTYTKTRVPLAPGFQGPMRLTEVVKKGTTMAISTLNFLLTRGELRRGDGLVSTPESRRAERLFGEGGSGRIGLVSAGCKLEMLAGDGYTVRGDTCVKAFVRAMATMAASVAAL
jgi:hypothetical protein